MTTFVVLAAGRGSRLGRLGDELPKCLIPLNSRAVLSHQFELAPVGARLVVVIGYRADQVREYVRLAHPGLDVTFVVDERWGAGPGVSLLAARDVIGDDNLVFTACDTLWDEDWGLWTADASWLAVAPIPAGTPAARWCRVVPSADGAYAIGVEDKTPNAGPTELAWTAFGHVMRDDLRRFWSGLDGADERAGEIQLSSGLDAIINGGWPVKLKHINWLDVGDEQAYRSALAARTGYDPLKPDQVTYVLDDRVVKFHVDSQKVAWRAERAKLIGDAVPAIVEPRGTTMVAYDLVDGRSIYDWAGEATPTTVTSGVLNWWHENFLMTSINGDRPPNWRSVTTKFYRDKTFNRVMSLDLSLRSVALDAITRVDWDTLVDGCVPGVFHGDLTYANVLVCDEVDWNLTFAGIDWREDFAGEVAWGDLRYDLGKLLGGTVVHWERAAYGDFRRWSAGPEHAPLILDFARQLGWDARTIEIIGALTLINSATLHASPLDEILIARGCNWLTGVT